MGVLQNLVQELQKGMDEGKIRIKEISRPRHEKGNEIKYTITVEKVEQK